MEVATFFEKLKLDISELEKELCISSIREVYPNLFILGLPRSGTTFLNQLLFNCLDIACTNNLMARFPETPLVGGYLSKIVLGYYKPKRFDSIYGKTIDIASPHEFLYFWDQLIGMDSKKIETYNLDEAKKRINWKQVKLKLLNLNNLFEKPMVYKPLELIGFHLREFCELFKKGLFIYIERDPLDVALSLANGRLDYYGDLDTWFSSYPLNYKELTNQPYWIQIAGQVYGLRKFYEEKLQEVSDEKIIFITYSDLCKQPKHFLERIIEKSKQQFDYNIKLLYEPPESFLVSKPKVNSPLIEDKLIDGLKHFYIKI